MSRDLPVIQSNDACCREVREPAILPEPDRERLLAVFKALADGTRFDVYRLIAAQAEPICACDIVDRFDVSQPTIAHHLKVLRQAGLITVYPAGNLGLLRGRSGRGSAPAGRWPVTCAAPERELALR